MTLVTPVTEPAPFKWHLRDIVASLMRRVEIPTGYQDENGFHLGSEPAQTETQWPPA